MSPRKRLLLSSLVLGVGLISPAVALAGPGGTDLPLRGQTSGVLSFDSSTGMFTSSSSGVGSLLGAFTVTNSGSLMPTGFNPPFVPYTVMGTQTAVAANGDQLFGTLNGVGVNNSATSAASGTNTITITGGTGRFANATGSYTVTYKSQATSMIGTIESGRVTTTFQGSINLG
jgi:hypothetical protein